MEVNNKVLAECLLTQVMAQHFRARHSRSLDLLFTGLGPMGESLIRAIFGNGEKSLIRSVVIDGRQVHVTVEDIGDGMIRLMLPPPNLDETSEFSLEECECGP